MTDAAAALLVVMAVVAVANWWAVGTRHRGVELVTKPAALVALIAVAVTLDPVDDAARAWFVVALVWSLAGDVFLMLEADRFVAGLAAFLAAHLAYGAGLVVLGVSVPWALVGVAVVSVALATIGRHIVGAARSIRPSRVGPVVAYLVVISAMVVAAWATARPVAVIGALLFYASDAMIGWREFVGPFPGVRVAVMSTYHLGQVGLVLALVA